MFRIIFQAVIIVFNLNSYSFSVIISILAFILILGTTYDVIIVHWLRKKEAPEKPYIDPTIKTSDGEKIPLLNHNSHDVHTDESNKKNFLDFFLKTIEVHLRMKVIHKLLSFFP